MPSNIRSTWPASRSCIAGPAPLYGTWFIFVPVFTLKSSAASWCDVPLPADAKLSLFGFAFA